MGYSLILDLAGAVALMLWAVRLVRTGMERGFAVPLRQGLRRSSESRVLSAIMGLCAAILMQSSTAVAIMTAGFVATGTLGAVVGLSVLLGADLGSAIVAQVLLVSPHWLIPALLVIGVATFVRGQRKSTRQVGRILVGIALVFLSLSMIREATGPLKDAAGVATVMRYLGNDLVTAFLIGAVFAWAAHSSVAAVLLVVTLATQGAVPVSGAMALVLGANFGGAMIGFGLTLASPHDARQVILGNVILRGGGALVFLAALVLLEPDPGWLGRMPGGQVINLHLLFNVTTALVGLGLLRPVLALAGLLIPQPPVAPGQLTRVSALDETVLNKPDQALACATREILTIGEAVETVLKSVLPLFETWSDDSAATIATHESRIDTMHFQTKLFLAKLHGSAMDEAASQRSMDLAIISVNLEAAGDLVSRNLVGLARKKQNAGLRFSEEGWRDLRDFHDRVLANAQLALNVLLTGDADAARQLIHEKEVVREIEAQMCIDHIERLRIEASASMESSNIHLEVLRSLKQINTGFSMIANPILSQSGDLLASRLATDQG